jgi:hypothetical protein
MKNYPTTVGNPKRSYSVLLVLGLMQIYNGAFPVIPAKKVALMQFIKDITGPMKKDFEKSEKRLGIKKETWFIQPDPSGDWLIIYMESNDMAKVFGDFAISKEPFDVLARNSIKEFTGVDLSTPPPQSSMPAQLFTYGY